MHTDKSFTHTHTHARTHARTHAHTHKIVEYCLIVSVIDTGRMQSHATGNMLGQ